MNTSQKQCMLKFFDCYEGRVDGIWGELSRKGTQALQRKLNLEPDGIWGDATDRAVREAIFSGEDLEVREVLEGTFWDGIRWWSREEFRCRCGEYHAPYCDGFPAEPDQTLVELLDDIRDHFGRPAHRSSGIRCPQHNADSGGVPNSKHLYGKAMDFFVEGISGETVRAYAAADPRCSYAYVIDGQYVHVDVN